VKVTAPRLRLRTWYQLVLFPTLLLISGILDGDLIFAMRQLILRDFDRQLRAAGMVTAAFVDGEAHERMMGLDAAAWEELGVVELVQDGRDLSALYREGVAPLQRVRERLGLTYLYTQTFGEGNVITYGLDSTVGEDFTPFGTQDELPLDELAGVERLIRVGEPHSTQLRRWDNWGMLKAVFVPFFASDGRVLGMVGADVDVNVVEHRTRHVLLMVMGGGALALLFASYWSWRAARSIRAPVEQLRHRALQAAVGEHEQFTIKGPAEVVSLSGEFQKLSECVHDAGRRARSRIEAVRSRALRDEQARRLRADWEGATLAARWPGANVGGDRGGLRHVGDSLVLWWAPPPETDEGRGVVAEQIVVRALVREAADRPPWPTGVAGVALLDAGTRRLVWAEGNAATVLTKETGLRLGGEAVGFVVDLPGAKSAEGGAG
jgi:hypothetical protein